LRNNRKSSIEQLYKKTKSPEKTPKTQKQQQPTGTKRIENTDIQSR